MSVTLREKKLAKGIGYYLDIYHDGKRSYESLFKVLPDDDKKAKKELAVAIKNKRELELFNNDFNFKTSSSKKIRIHDFMDDYLKSYDKKDINTIKACIFHFKNFSEDNFLLKNLTSTILEDYYYYLEKSNLRGDTPRSYYRRFRKVLNYAVKMKYLNNDIMVQTRIKPSSLESSITLKKEILTEEEIIKLYETECGNREVKRAFLFSCYTGLGYAEIVDLRHSNVVNGRLRVFRKKTGTEVNIKLSNTAKKLIGTDSHDNKIFDLFNKANGKYYSETGVNKTISNWVKRAKINKKITYYCSRHTFAVRLLSNGANIKVVSDSLGHKSLNNTYKYLNFVDKLKDEATSNL